MVVLYLAIAAGIVALGFALFLTLMVLREDEGDETIRFIGKAAIVIALTLCQKINVHVTTLYADIDRAFHG